MAMSLGVLVASFPKPLTDLRTILGAFEEPIDLENDEMIRRVMKRGNAVNAIRNSDSYARVAARFPGLLPCEPNPYHYRVQSKRDWEEDVMRWRRELRQLAWRHFDEMRVDE